MPPSERTRLLMTTFSWARLVTASAARRTRLAAAPWHSVQAGMYLHRAAVSARRPEAREVLAAAWAAMWRTASGA